MHTQEVNQIINSLLSSYSFTWGGIKLSQGETSNDNGVLFLAYAAFLTKMAGGPVEAFKENFVTSQYLCRVTQGLYRRSPDASLMDAKDNYIARCALSKLFHTSDVYEICDYGEGNYWHFNDQRDGIKFTALLDPGDIAVIKIAAERKPSFLQRKWLSVGMKHSKGGLLTWLRSELLDLSQNVPVDVRGAQSKWLKGFFAQGPLEYHVKSYFQDPTHPIRRLSELARV
jgi:hypothetical protein